MNDKPEQPVTVLEALAPYPLHLLGWNAFQDLAVSVAEVCLNRPVQRFLPTNDAGRDGAFIGRWSGENAGRSTIQCKFTSKAGQNLSLSMLDDELSKVKRLVALGEADDYIIITNHPVTGESDLAIKAAFMAEGVKECRIFGADWINQQVRSSPKLRMLAPRLYGLGDLHDLLDGRAYQQAQMILSAMGARAETILFEVVCAGEQVQGAPLVVPAALNELLVARIENVEATSLRVFMSYRSNRVVNEMLIARRPDVLKGFTHFTSPISEDQDASLLSKLHRQGLLSEEHRGNFVKSVMDALVEEADSSFLEVPYLDEILSEAEMADFINTARAQVLPNIDTYVDNRASAWDHEYHPEDHFEQLESSISRLCDTVSVDGVSDQTPLIAFAHAVKLAVYRMEDEYVPPSQSSHSAASPKVATVSEGIFRDVDE